MRRDLGDYAEILEGELKEDESKAELVWERLRHAQQVFDGYMGSSLLILRGIQSDIERRRQNLDLARKIQHNIEVTRSDGNYYGKHVIAHFELLESGDPVYNRLQNLVQFPRPEEVRNRAWFLQRKMIDRTMMEQEYNGVLTKSDPVLFPQKPWYRRFIPL